MISAFRVKKLMSLDIPQLIQALERGGYTDVFLDSCYFHSLTSSNKFCYEAVYTDDYNVIRTIKIYVWHDADLGCAVADF